MSAPVFTPGPWEAVHRPIGNFGSDYRQIHAQNGAVVSPHGFQRSRDGETWTEYGCVISEADARLIACAPTLFDEVVFAYDAKKDDDGRWVDRNGDYVRVLNKAEGISIPA